uniref:DRBM domain-containing protein n=2 Tax=Vespula pensylvanica TaxID=30213 RepID=A0A834NG72_VESPE|nr:hypothetical protein H0235_013782 [Vespula pensylvanica]
MGKTAVMILQELGVKEGFLPVYTLIRSQTGKHINIFTFEVRYKDFSATGQALTKKDAKQKAAQNMLTLLEDPNDTSKAKPSLSSNNIYPGTSSGQALLDSTLTHEDLKNYVGSLQQYCIENKLMQADYQVTNITGQAHEQVFTMSCTVGSTTEEATGTTKKQVKQRVSKKILERLKNTNNPSVDNKDECGSSNPFKDSDDLSEEGKDVFDKLSLQLHNCELNETESQANKKEKFLDANVERYLEPQLRKDVTDFQTRHSFFKQYVYNTVCNCSEEKLIEIFNTVKSFKSSFMDIDKYDFIKVASLEQEILTYIEKKMKLSIEKKIIRCKNPLLKITAFKISTPLAIIQFGAHNNSLVAGAIALVNILDTIITYLGGKLNSKEKNSYFYSFLHKGIFPIPDTEKIEPAPNALPLTIICENIRDPANLGSIIRIAAGVGCEKLILLKGCVDLWDMKVLRSAVGAHFRLPIYQSTSNDLSSFISDGMNVFVTDNNTIHNTNKVFNNFNSETKYSISKIYENFDLQNMEFPKSDETLKQSEMKKIIRTLKSLLPILPYYAVDYCTNEIALVISGETEGLSLETLKFLWEKRAVRVNVPLLNNVESLNVGAAIAIISFEIQRQIVFKQRE